MNINKWSDASDSEFIEALLNKANELGKTPTAKEMPKANDKHPGKEQYVARFGSWNEALEASGLRLNKTRTEYGRSSYLSHSIPVQERLWRSCYPASSGCWEWLAGRDREAYGVIFFDGKKHLAHRVAYEVWVGEIEPGNHIHHSCFQRSCINPEHLLQVTPSQHSKIHRDLRAEANA